MGLLDMVGGLKVEWDFRMWLLKVEWDFRMWLRR